MSTPYKLQLSLRQITMVQTAINFWEQHEIKHKIKDFFLNHDIYTICRRIDDEMSVWTYDILENVRRPRILPDSLKDDMIYMITSIGDRKIKWLKYISEKLNESRDRISALEHYLDNIFWTTYGTIDPVKIFKSLYIDGKITDIPYMYEEACNYCLEEEIKSLWEKSSTDDRDAISWKIRCNMGDNCNNVHLLVYWKWYISGRKSHLLIKSSYARNYDDIDDFNHSAKENAFRLSAIGGYDVAVKYFYHELSDDEKNRNLLEITEILLNDKILSSAKYTEEDYRWQYIDILVFLMQQMTDTQRNELLKKRKDDILKILLANWPWEALFIPTLEQTWEYFSREDFVLLIMEIENAILDEYELHDTKETTLQCILFETWDKTPVALKKRVSHDCWLVSHKFVRTMEDITFTKYVINDPDLKDERQQMLVNGEAHCYDLIIDRKYNVVEKIMEEILYNDEERDNFKNKIDSLRICQCFITYSKYRWADAYLNWQFDTKEERVNFKNLCKSNDTCSSIIYAIWRTNESVAEAKRKSDTMFRWFGYDESDRETLKNQLQSSRKFPWFLVEIIQDSNENKLEEFLDCCQFTQDEVDVLKHQANQAVKWQNRIYTGRHGIFVRFD